MANRENEQASAGEWNARKKQRTMKIIELQKRSQPTRRKRWKMQYECYYVFRCIMARHLKQITEREKNLKKYIAAYTFARKSNTSTKKNEEKSEFFQRGKIQILRHKKVLVKRKKYEYYFWQRIKKPDCWICCMYILNKRTLIYVRYSCHA